MKKLLIALTAAASAFGLYADVAIGGAGFDSKDAAPFTWVAGSGFDADYWSNYDGALTLTSGDSDKFTKDRPAGYSEDRDGYMAIKTTLGTPVFQNIKAKGLPQDIDPNFFYDGLVQFTAFDETPDMTAYTDAKIGIFPMLENPDSETAYLWVYANGNPATTNLWKTTKVIDGDWHRVTIKMIKNVTRTAGATDVGFVVFIDGEAVNADNQAAFAGLDLNPAALAYYNNGQLFRSLAPTANEFTGVAYDGQGLLDEVGFTDLAGAPDWALDENWATVSWTSDKIAKVYITDGTSVVKESDTGFADFVRAAETTYYYYYDAIPGFIGIPAEGAIEITAATTAITEEPVAAAFEIGSTPYATWSNAVAAAAGEVTITVKGAYTMTEDDLAASIDNEGGLTTIDFAGSVLTGKILATTAIKFVDSSEDKTGGLVGIDPGSEGVLTAAEVSEATIEAGKFDGYIWCDTAVITGGSFLEQEGSKEFYLAEYVAKGYVADPTVEEGYWTIVADTKVEFAVTAGANSKAAVKINDVLVEEIPEKLEKDDTYEVTFTANEGYAFAQGAQTVFSGTAEDEAIKIEGPDAAALPIVAYVNTAPYYSLASAIAAINEGQGGDTLTFNDNIEATADDMILIAKNATVDFNGKTFTIANSLLTADPSKNGWKVFGVAAGAEVTFQNGTVEIGASGSGSGRSIVVRGTLNVNCTMTRKGSASPLFDIYDGTVNVRESAVLASDSDVFRTKELNEGVGGSTVTVAAGAQVTASESSANTRGMFYNYKSNLTMKVTLNGGQFTQTGKGAFFSNNVGASPDAKWDVTISPTAQFSTDNIQAGVMVLTPTQKAVKDGDWYCVKPAAVVSVSADPTYVTVAGYAPNYAAGETVAFTVTPVDETVKVIDAVTVNGETLTAGEAGAYSWTVPATLPPAIEIGVTVKDPASPIIDPTDPESKQTVEAKDETEAIAKAEVGVPEAAKDYVTAEAYKAYFNFTANDIGGGKFEVAIAGLKADVVEAPTTADLVAKFDEIGEDGLTVVAKPGLFYGVKQAGAVDGVAAATVDAADGIATDGTVTLPVQKQGDAGFYKVVVDVKPLK